MFFLPKCEISQNKLWFICPKPVLRKEECSNKNSVVNGIRAKRFGPSFAQNFFFAIIDYRLLCVKVDFFNRWKHVPAMKQARNFLASTVLNENLFALGGSDGANRLNTVER